jgi:predicted ribosomally synthesized peptide with SipW-like signal peptide
MNIRKLLGSALVAGGVLALGVVGTRAFFSDTEVSTGNVLQAGALDLKIDNTCYYNGLACVEGFWDGHAEDEDFACSCTWQSKDLEEGDVFFNFRDLKPGDWEEDTISLHVDNPAWVCARARLASDDDFSCTEPELADDPSCTDPGAPGNANAFDGELASNLHFVFWNDDGDNVLEEGEEIITQGQGGVALGASWPLADSSTGEPIPAGEDFFIGKAFCYGTLGLDPVTPGDNSPVGPITNSGITCDGEPVNNASQTDIATGAIVFQAVQARHNDEFLCNPTPSPSPSPSPAVSPNPSPSPTIQPT